MFNKRELGDLKQVVGMLQDNLGALEARQQETTEQLQAITTLLEQLTTRSDERSEQKAAFEEQINQQIASIASAALDLETAVRTFKDLQHKIELHTFEKINVGIDKAVADLKRDTEKYTDTKVHINEVGSKLEQLKLELTKFMTISKQLKETDFEFRDYVKTLTANDHEKLKLMKEIDSLQRLVASLRRKVRT